MSIKRIHIVRPVITEKSVRDAGRGVFTFITDEWSTKHQIVLAIEELFKVHVQKITTVIRKGKTKSTGKKRLKVTMPNQKKARVTLTKGEKIDLFEISKKS